MNVVCVLLRQLSRHMGRSLRLIIDGAWKAPNEAIVISI
jgi:hypothetical protein